jgi:predicted aldo/keto reductase-like oxidoreductase
MSRKKASLGQQEFSKLVAYAYERGIRFFETAESYATPAMLGEALKPYPRDSYRIMNKVTTEYQGDPHKKLDELRSFANMEYFDVMLLHWQHTGNWPAESARWQDAILEAEQKKTIVSHGASVHGLPALRQVPGNKWLDIAMIRVNHNGTRMDAEIPDLDDLGNVNEVVTHIAPGEEGRYGRDQHEADRRRRLQPRRPQKAMRFAFQNAKVDCVTVGYKNTAEVDEAIENLNLALA